jgi:hypothetical protein
MCPGRPCRRRCTKLLLESGRAAFGRLSGAELSMHRLASRAWAIVHLRAETRHSPTLLGVVFSVSAGQKMVIERRV